MPPHLPHQMPHHTTLPPTSSNPPPVFSPSPPVPPVDATKFLGRLHTQNPNKPIDVSPQPFSTTSSTLSARRCSSLTLSLLCVATSFLSPPLSERLSTPILRYLFLYNHHPFLLVRSLLVISTTGFVPLINILLSRVDSTPELSSSASRPPTHDHHPLPDRRTRQRPCRRPSSE